MAVNLQSAEDGIPLEDATTRVMGKEAVGIDGPKALEWQDFSRKPPSFT